MFDLIYINWCTDFDKFSILFAIKIKSIENIHADTLSILILLIFKINYYWKWFFMTRY